MGGAVEGAARGEGRGRRAEETPEEEEGGDARAMTRAADGSAADDGVVVTVADLKYKE